MKNFRLKPNENDQSSQRKISYLEHDDSSEDMDELLQTVSKEIFPMLKNFSSMENSLLRINNINLIGIFNASVVKVGEFNKYSENDKNNKPQTKTCKENGYNTSELKPTKIKMPEYLDKAGNTGKSTFILNNLSTTMQTTENHLEVTCHYPSKTKV